MVYLLFPLIEFPSRSISISHIRLGSNPRLLQCLRKIVARIIDSCPICITRLSRDPTRHHNYLDTRYPRRKHQALIIPMHHDHDTDRSCAQPPRILPHVCLPLTSRVIRILDDDVEHLRPREVLAEAMRGTTLDSATCGRNEPFDSGCVEATGELLFLRFDTRDHRHGEEVFIHPAVEIENFAYFDVSFFFGQVSGVPLLPQEFTCTEERF